MGFEIFSWWGFWCFFCNDFFDLVFMRCELSVDMWSSAFVLTMLWMVILRATCTSSVSGRMSPIWRFYHCVPRSLVCSLSLTSLRSSWMGAVLMMTCMMLPAMMMHNVHVHLVIVIWYTFELCNWMHFGHSGWLLFLLFASVNKYALAWSACAMVS